jgi:hypothetical protein
LKYPLAKDEYKAIKHVWDFLNIFDMDSDSINSDEDMFESTVYNYRENLIEHIYEKYSPDEFFILEEIVNKLFWNLRHKVFNIIFPGKEFDHKYFSCSITKFDSLDDIKKKLTFIGRSTINKDIMVDRTNKILIQKEPHNYFNLVTSYVLRYKQLYESIIRQPVLIKKVEPIKTSFDYDYGFPNINYGVYNFGDIEEKINRIVKLYYGGEYDNQYWWSTLIIDYIDLINSGIL